MISVRTIGHTIRRCDVGILRAAESVLVRNCPDEIEMPLLAVCGPPRSGHTLTYQVITQGLNVFGIDNFQYLFYRTPLIGYLLARFFCRPYVSDYRSRSGYIPGVNGPQQGVYIWNYWCDMYEKERPPQPDLVRLQKFGRIMNKLYTLNGRPFCSSWLGHVLYFEQLQNVFRRTIIVRTCRDLISTALSIGEDTRGQGGAFGAYRSSVQPRECQESAMISRLSPHERIAMQVYFINRRMDEQAASGRYKVFNSLYSDLCANPRGFIDRLTAFANAQGLVLTPRTDTEMPIRFAATTARRDQNEHARRLASAFDALLVQYGPVSVPLEVA